MEILCISDEYPWPATTGYRIRLAHVLEALGRVADIDLFCTVSNRPDLAAGELPPPDGVRRLYLHHHSPYAADGRGMLRWISSSAPRAVACVDWKDAPKALDRWARRGYDVAWFSHAHPWSVLGNVARAGRTIVDLDNLEDQKLQAMLRLRGAGRRRRLRSLARDAVKGSIDRVDVRRWRRVQAHIASVVDVVAVCSEQDRTRLGVDSATVIPNGFDPQPAGGGADPVLTMVGLMIYPPNADGARFFAESVLPRVRAAVPGTTFLVVGRHDGALDDLRDVPGVVLHGEAADLDPIFAATRVVVVPLRAGSGTRLKVLEAFARRLPVVATPLGCEGIDAHDGVEVLLGRSAEEIAAACVRVLTEPAVATAVADAGYELWQRSYQWPDIQRTIAEVALG